MRIFRNKPFTRFARKARIGGVDQALADSRHRLAEIGDLGGGVIKQRVARKGGGKSGGFRVLVLLKVGQRAFFVHGFAKSDRDNLRDDELAALRKLAAELLNYTDAELAKAVATGVLTEVTGDEQAIS